MKKLVAWKEEPVMETSAENEETVNRADMGRDEKPTFEEDIDKPIVKSERRPTKKDIDREEGRKGSERRRRESRYKEDSHRSSSSHRPTESNPSTHSSERRSTIRPYRTKRTSEWKEIMEHQDKMSRLETSLRELYPTSRITVQDSSDEDPASLYKKWSNGDIPIEKLLTDGVDQLSESELLAIIMGNGPREYPTVDLMNRVLDDCANDLNRLAKKTVEELMFYRGIGKNRAISVVAACEFGKRFRKTAPEEKPILKDALAVGNYMIPQLEDLDHLRRQLRQRRRGCGGLARVGGHRQAGGRRTGPSARSGHSTRSRSRFRRRSRGSNGRLPSSPPHAGVRGRSTLDRGRCRSPARPHVSAPRVRACPGCRQSG